MALLRVLEAYFAERMHQRLLSTHPALRRSSSMRCGHLCQSARARKWHSWMLIRHSFDLRQVARPTSSVGSARLCMRIVILGSTSSSVAVLGCSNCLWLSASAFSLCLLLQLAVGIHAIFALGDEVRKL